MSKDFKTLFGAPTRTFQEVDEANRQAAAAREKAERRAAPAPVAAPESPAAGAAATPPPAAASDLGRLTARSNVAAGALRPTAEQEAIVDAARRLRTAKAIAGAGAAKTTSLAMAAEASRGRRLAFLVYNKAAETDAKARFPDFVDVSTAHSFAFRALGGVFGPKIQRRPFPEAVARLGDLGEDGRAGVAILQAISKFCLSTDRDFGLSHFVDRQDFEALLEPTRKVWRAMSDPNDDFPATHDVYLKVWALAGERPRYDMLFVDEAQDMWPAISEAVKRMGLPTIYVGDPYQQIYSFRGAVNALDSIDAPVLPLTMSWRFGETIAGLANGLLGLRPSLGLAAPAFRLRGQPQLASEWVVGNEAAPRLDRGSFAYLCRTNAGIIQAALAAGKASIHIVGGGDDVFAQIEDAWRIKNGQQPKTYEMRRFRNWRQLEDMADIDIEMKLAVKLVEDHGAKLPAVLNSIRERTVAERKADIVLSTLHRSKGREWDEVAIGDDIPSIAGLYKRQKSIVARGGRFDPSKIAEELNLLYVGGTRAKRLMRIPDAMEPARIAAALASIDAEMENAAARPVESPVLRRIGGAPDRRPAPVRARAPEPREERSVMDAAGWGGDRKGNAGGWRIR